VHRSLADATWQQAQDAKLVLVPVGSLEQHGPHLPLDTDTVIAEAVTRRVAAGRPGTWVAPVVSFGASGEHQSFAGTSSIGTEVLHLMLVELVRSMRAWARRVVFVNAHGGNVAGLSAAVDQLTAEDHDVAWVPCATEELDLHAGFTETSLMLHLRPESVRVDRAEAGCTAPLTEILPTLLTGGVVAVSANGVLGNPAGATAEEGARILDAIVEQVQARLSGVGAR
jgi:mycofactocin system creatininase family protein